MPADRALPPELHGLVPVDPDDPVDADLDGLTLDPEAALAQLRAVAVLGLLGIDLAPARLPEFLMLDVTPARHSNRDRAAVALANMRRAVSVRHPRIMGDA